MGDRAPNNEETCMGDRAPNTLHIRVLGRPRAEHMPCMGDLAPKSEETCVGTVRRMRVYIRAQVWKAAHSLGFTAALKMEP